MLQKYKTIFNIFDMKKNLFLHTFIILFVIFISSCSMSKHYLKKQNYDRATREAVKKLQKNPTKEKEILVLREAFPKANQVDNERIAALHKAGQPDRWNEIFKIYSKMEVRQVLVENITPLQLETEKVEFEHVDYDQKIIESKLRAAAYYYNHGRSLLEQNDKFLARNAYEEFKIVQEYTTNYSDISSLIAESHEKGMSHVALAVENNARTNLPDNFLFNLVNFDVNNFDSEWIKYYPRDTRNGKYDVYVSLNLRIVDVSPESVTNNEELFTKEVEDG